MTDTNNVADTFGGGAHKRRDENRLPAHLMPKPVPVPTFTDGDPGAVADSERVVDQLTSVMRREVGSINRPAVEPRQQVAPSSPLKEIAQRIKKLVHDDGEQMGDELKAKIESNGDKISVAKALQKWADDTLAEKKESPTAA